MKNSTQLACLFGLLALASCSSTASTTRTFEVQNRFTVDVPEGTKTTRAWFALPDDGEGLQEIQGLKISAKNSKGAEVPTRQVRDANNNRFLYLELAGGGESLEVNTTFEVKRQEATHSVDPKGTRALTAAESAEMAAYLGQSQQVVITPEIRAGAAEVVGDETNPMVQARKLYDWTLGHMQYWVKFPDVMKSSGVGSSTYAFEKCTGNCTDFHSLYTAAARSVGLPTRMVYGSFFKLPLDGQAKDQSYHCWIEFWVPNLGWTPLDVAVADLYIDDFAVTEANSDKVALTLADGYAGPDAARVDYYFGNLDARRVTWNRGRDLLIQPEPKAGAINALPKAHVEFDGASASEKKGWTRELTFKEIQ